MRRQFHRSISTETILTVTAIGVVVFLAVAARFYHLGAYHTHWDEGVHAYYTWQFADAGEFTYEAWRHGPLLYYLTAPFVAAGAETVLAGRAVVATLSLGMFAALYLLRDELPASILWFAVIVLAVHPYVLTTARFFRNDAVVATACLLLVGFCVQYRRSPSWPLAAAIGATLGIALATKETVYLLVPAIVLPVVVIAHFEARYTDRSAKATLDAYVPLRYLPGTLAAFIVVVLVFYSGWPPQPFRAFPSLVDGITYWLEKGADGDPDLTYYASRLLEGTPVLSGLAALGAVGTIVRPRSAWLRWVFLSWATFALLLFSLIADQSWWVLVVIFTPTVVLAGCGFHDGLLFARRIAGRVGPTVPLNDSQIAQSVLGVTGPMLAALLVIATVTAGIGPAREVAGLTQPATPDHQRTAFDLARSSAIETGCVVDVGPDAHEWPGRWWLRGIDVNEVDEISDIQNQSVVIDTGSLDGLNRSTYTTTEYRNWTVYTPVTSCDA